MSDAKPVIALLDVNEWLRAGSEQLDLILSVQAPGLPTSSLSRPQGVIFVYDLSGSMRDGSPRKIDIAKAAGEKALAAVPDGTAVSIIGFSSQAALLFRAAVLDQGNQNRQLAIAQVHAMKADGGTYVSHALAMAREQAVSLRQKLVEHAQAKGASQAEMDQINRDASINVYLLTDGDNNEPDAPALKVELTRQKTYGVQVRGLGTGYDPQVLRDFAKQFGVGEKFIDDRSPEGLSRDILDTIQKEMGKGIQRARLHMWYPKLSQLRVIEKRFPDKLDITGQVVSDPNAAVDHYVDIGSLGKDEPSEFFVSFNIPRKDVGEKRCVARLSVVYELNGQTFEVPAEHTTPKPADMGEEPNSVWAHWTGDLSKSMRVPQALRHYQNADEVTQKVQSALDDLQSIANEEGKGGSNEATERLRREATEKLSRARAKAEEIGDAEKVKDIDKLLDKHPDGTVQLKRDAANDRYATQALASGSVRTVRQPRQASA